MIRIVKPVSDRYDRRMNKADLPDQIRQLCGVLNALNRRLAAEHDLQPVHLDVLRYLARCNRYSNTPAAIGQYLQTTKGTVSQTINLLERNGFVAKLADANDRRVVRLKLLNKGTRLLKALDENNVVEQAADRLDSSSRNSFQKTVAELLRAAQQINEHRPFGQCHTCRFFLRPSKGKYQCGVTGESLSEADSELICVEHEYSHS